MSDGVGAERKTLPIACDLTSMSDSQRKRHRNLSEYLRENVREVRELPEGYEFRFVYEPSSFLTVSEFVTLERLCCPFIDFQIEVRSEEDHLSLRTTGEAETKHVMRAELGLYG